MITIHVLAGWLLLAHRVLAATELVDGEVTALPIVNLGYERHKAINFNDVDATYNFSNIPYALAPVAELRFRAPVPVQGDSTHINNGSIGRICPQPASLLGNVALSHWISAYLQGTTLDYPTVQSQYANVSASSSSDPRVSEDCLFLDVIVPKKIFDGRESCTGAPVLVWIHGGGYIVGEKTGFGHYNPTELLQSASNDQEFIFVSLNYRLGAFGFLGGSTIQRDGVANAGLLDQRLALDWVSRNVHLFGGSASHVTVMGESAGGGSIVSQVAAYGGSRGPVPFQQAILQSAALRPVTSSTYPEDVLQSLFSAVNVSSMGALRAVSLSDLDAANTQLAAQGDVLVFGPTVDGTFIPEPWTASLANGRYDQSVKTLVGDNSHEGALFAVPSVNSSAAYSNFLHELIPGISNASASYMENVLYPEVFDGTYGYTSQLERGLVTYQEICFTCTAPMFSHGMGNVTNNYLFAVPPGYHAQDIPYTYYFGSSTPASGFTAAPATEGEIDVAHILQSWIANFVTTGSPSASGGIPFDLYGSDANVLVLNVTNTGNQSSAVVSRGVDPAYLSGRCAWLAGAIQHNTILTVR